MQISREIKKGTVVETDNIKEHIKRELYWQSNQADKEVLVLLTDVNYIDEKQIDKRIAEI